MIYIIIDIIFNYAYSFLFINKYGIIHLDNKSTAIYTTPYDIKLFGKLFLVDIMFEFSKNNSDKNYAIRNAYGAKNMFNKKKLMNDNNVKFFKSMVNKFLNCPYISKNIRDKIKNDFKLLFSPNISFK